MKKIYKILLFVISLAGIAAALGIMSVFYYIPFITDVITSYRAQFIWANVIFAGYCAVICVIFLLLAIIAALVPSKKDMIFLKSKGKLEFSKQTIESTIRYSFADIKKINSSKVRAKINRKPDKTRVYVKLSLSDTNELVDLTETVQQKIENALQSSLGIAAKSINIKVAEFSSINTAQKELGKSNDEPKESRVI